MKEFCKKCKKYTICECKKKKRFDLLCAITANDKIRRNLINKIECHMYRSISWRGLIYKNYRV